MKRRTTLLLSSAVTIAALFSFNSKVQAAADPTIKATNYNMIVKLDTRKNQLTEKVTMHVVNNGNEPVRNLLVRNIASGVLKYDHKHFEATRNATTSVKNISSDGQKLSYTTGKDKSNLFVNKSLNTGESTDLTVNVVTGVPKRQDRFGYQNINGGKVYTLSFCFPYLSDYRNGKWNYHPYYDAGENRNSAVSNFHVSFFAPKSYKVAASGKNTTKNGKTTIVANNMREVGIAASNKFKVDHAYANGVYDLTYTKSKAYCAKLMHSKFYTRKNVKRANKILKENATQFINKNQKASYINYPVNNPPKGVDTEDMAYELGMDFPAVLKVAMGENKFFDALHDYYQTYYLKQATTQDFLNIIRKYDNSKKVNNVINKFIDPKYLSE